MITHSNKSVGVGNGFLSLTRKRKNVMEKKIIPGENVFSEGTDLSLPGSVTVRKDGNDTPSDSFAVYHFDGEFLYKFGMGVELGFTRRWLVPGGLNRVSFNEQELDGSGYELFPLENVSADVKASVVDYVMWVVLGWS